MTIHKSKTKIKYFGLNPKFGCQHADTYDDETVTITLDIMQSSTFNC